MAWLAAIPDLLTAAGFLLIWLRPDLTGPAWVANGVATMLLEFFVIHASGFYAAILYGDSTRFRRTLYLAGLAALYLLLVAAFAWGMHAWWITGAFFWLSFGKAVTIWTGHVAADKDRQMMITMAGWATSVLCYLGAVMASALLQWPTYGVTPEVIRAAGYDGNGGGDWEAQPHCALAAGFLYFGIRAVLRLLGRLILLRPHRPARHGARL